MNHCVTCGDPTDSTVLGREGDRTGPICEDCQEFCDGNVVARKVTCILNVGVAGRNIYQIAEWGPWDGTPVTDMNVLAEELDCDLGQPVIIELIDERTNGVVDRIETFTR